MTTGFRSPTTAYTAARRSIGSRVTDRESILRRLDWVLLLAVAGLLVMGTLLVWSATKQIQLDAGLDPNAYLRKDLINITLGLVLGGMTALFDYRSLRAYAPLVYVASMLGLLAVLAPGVGSTINGAHSWILLPAGFSVQPAEFVKVALCVALPMLLAERRDAEDEPRASDVGLALAVGGGPVVLVLLQPDLGTVVVFAFIVLGVLAVANTPTRWMVGLLAMAAAGAALAVKVGVLHQYQIARLTAFANPAADPLNTGYNVQQARIAIGSGGLFGKGLFHGTQTNGKFVPEQQTDFVFTVAGEELGFVGAGLLIVLLGVVLWRGMRIAVRAQDLFGTLVATGIVCWFTFQAFENIGMALGIMPVTGVPLPLVSYGGSSMFATLMAVGLLQNVHMRRYA
jgi:rod shape determining protein RodA